MGAVSKDPLQGTSSRKDHESSRLEDSHDSLEFERKLKSLGGALAIADHGLSQDRRSFNQGLPGTKTQVESAGLHKQRERVSVSRREARQASDLTSRRAPQGETPRLHKSLSERRGTSTLSEAQGRALFDELSEYLPSDVADELRTSDLHELSLSSLDTSSEQAGLTGLEDESQSKLNQSLIQNGFVQTLNGLAKVSTSPGEKAQLGGSSEGQSLIQGLSESELNRVDQSLDLYSVRGRKGMSSNGDESHLGQSMFFGQKDMMGFHAQIISPSVSRPQFSEDTLSLMSQQVMKTLQKGGGEFKMRISPEYLGDMTIHVRAQGNEVILKIHATDQRVKDILQDSITSLQDKLSSQQLVLARCDVSVISPSSDDSSYLAGQFSQRQDGMNQGWEHGFHQQQGSQDQGSRLRHGELPSRLLRGSSGQSNSIALGSLSGRANLQKQGKLDLHA